MWVPGRLATPRPAGSLARLSREVQRAMRQSSCRPDRCSRKTRSRLVPAQVTLERKSSLALHGVEFRASGCPTAAASRPVNVQTKTTMR
ncbi:hypothetical protein DPMN_011631 [Dreissena polymorpha]|uniref:Uncharacterized protein n=1 Tax=Dreissena polymorpha TaxID=45954 RepID=A0A9D4N0X8_DREPO|nr:hypothetical protein DPMN_011631 [Dreissena polymorpha]